MLSVLLNTCCIIAFLVQISFITYGYIKPERPITETFRQDLDEMEFPVVFKVCVIPAFNDSAVKKEGYRGATGFFDGKSRFNDSILGWGGHVDGIGKPKSSNGSNIFCIREKKLILFIQMFMKQLRWLSYPRVF
jgi:hypothetical protein